MSSGKTHSAIVLLLGLATFCPAAAEEEGDSCVVEVTLSSRVAGSADRLMSKLSESEKGVVDLIAGVENDCTMVLIEIKEPCAQGAWETQLLIRDVRSFLADLNLNTTTTASSSNVARMLVAEIRDWWREGMERSGEIPLTAEESAHLRASE